MLGPWPGRLSLARRPPGLRYIPIYIILIEPRERETRAEVDKELRLREYRYAPARELCARAARSGRAESEEESASVQSTGLEARQLATGTRAFWSHVSVPR